MNQAIFCASIAWCIYLATPAVIFAETGVGAVCNYGEIRLQDGLISAQFGRVEVCFNGQWGVVCGINHFFDGLDAAVACRQLGIEGVCEI